MDYNLIIKENLLNLLGLVVLSISFVTIIGYFDEGHARIYGSFSNYLAAGGYPPLSDYLLWSIITVIFGGIIFNIISKLAPKPLPLTARLFTTAATIPFAIFVFLTIFVGLVYASRMLF